MSPTLARAPGRLAVLAIAYCLTCVRLFAASPEQTNIIWSLRPLEKPDPPETKNKSWAKTPVDRFILAKLEGKGMKPSQAADKRTLLRRVTFDLTGLPPTPRELENFLSDKSPNAFPRVVDRLLASPRYGERWALHWMDVVHYADTHGHDEDRVRTNAWPYRDFLVRSFNDDTPYARFVQEQIAGDALFPNEPDGVVALGFLATGPWDSSSQMAIMEDTADKKIARYLDRDDMVSTVMSTFVSTTSHCARCHNHKFDPISQKEYYALQAVFAGVDRVDRPYDLDAKAHAARQALLKRKLFLEVHPRDKSLLEPATQSKVAAWEKSLGIIQWSVLEPQTIQSKSSTLAKQPDNSILATGTRPEVDTYTISAQTDLKAITAVRVEVLADDSLPQKGPGRADNGNITVTEFFLKATPKDQPDSAKTIALTNASADFDQKDWESSKAIDGNTNTGWGIHPAEGKSHFAVFELKKNICFDDGTILTFIIEQNHGGSHLIGRTRLAVTSAQRPVKAPSLPYDIWAICDAAPESRTDEQKSKLATFVLKQEIDAQLEKLPPPQKVYAVSSDFEPQNKFTPAKTPRLVYLLKRGDINKPGDLAPPGALSVVSGLQPQFDLADSEDEGSRRAALAQWITDPQNVLTWRSIVNRVWHYHFGRGIVDSPNDFGQMGSRPTHPELLDWLALWFRDNGGSIKKLHKLLLTSAVYQQSSADGPAFSKIDSGNALLWRMNRTRLDAEEVRDAILQMNGKLDLKMGGPSAMQFHLDTSNENITPRPEYTKLDLDSPANYRRSVYRFIYRTMPDPFMDTLDCADASQLTPVRTVSTTALQALAMWNNRFVLHQSELLAQSLSKAGKLEKQIRALFVLALGREPKRAEFKEFKAYAAEHRMANACRVILNSNEFLFVN